MSKDESASVTKLCLSAFVKMYSEYSSCTDDRFDLNKNNRRTVTTLLIHSNILNFTFIAIIVLIYYFLKVCDALMCKILHCCVLYEIIFLSLFS